MNKVPYVNTPELALVLPFTGSPSRGGDVAVYVLDTNQPSLPAPFYSVPLSISAFVALSTVLHSIIISTILCLLSLFFLSYIWLIGPFNSISLTKVSFSPDITPSG